MSREMGYYEFKLMMMNEGMNPEWTQLLDDAMIKHGNDANEVFNTLRSEVYDDATGREMDAFRAREENRSTPAWSLLRDWFDYRGAAGMEDADILSRYGGARDISRYTEGLPKLRGRKYHKVTGAQLRGMIAEDCGSAKKLGQFADFEEELPPVGTDPTLPAGVITKVQDVGPDFDGDGMGPDEPSSGRKMGHGGKAKMTRQQLYNVAEDAVELWNTLADEDEIPEWCQSKVAVMADAMSKVRHHLEYKAEKPSKLSLSGDSYE